MKLNKAQLLSLIRGVAKTSPDEIGCDDCFDKLNEFAELQLDGKNPEEAMPLIEKHLKRCRECCEEYEALLESLRALK